MEKLTFKEIEDRGLLLYKYIRGSHCCGCNVETSDIDEGGVYMAPAEQLLGLGLDYQDEIKDERNDKSWFELNKFMNLLLKSNPTVLEALYVDDEFVLYEHPIMTEIKKNRDIFLTKACFKPFFGYAQSQIHKARGLNKKIVNPIVERRGLLDFVYTFPEKVVGEISEGNVQGSTKIEHWLEFRGLKQKYCGLVNIANMKDTYGVFYDWGMHFQDEGITQETIFNAIRGENEHSRLANYFVTYFSKDAYGLNITDIFMKIKPIGYRGMIKEDCDSNELRLSSVEKGVKPICWIQYNMDGYSKHCRDYIEYKEWEANRNQARYESNLTKNYDSKNMYHCFRLINMGIEIAEGKGFLLNRKGIDRDFLINVRNHKYEYDNLIEMLVEKEARMREAEKHCTLPEEIDSSIVNDLLVKIRKEQLGLK